MDALAYLAGLSLDKDSSLPLYQQIEEGMLQLIATHAFDDKPLPTEISICSVLGVSRATVRRCFEDLTKNGKIVRQRGKGTFVAPAQINHETDVSLNFTARMKTLGKNPTSSLLSLKRLVPASGVAQQLALAPKDEVWEIRRLRLADGRPMEYHTVYIPYALVPSLTKSDLDASLYACIAERAQVLPASASATIEAIVLDATEACLFGLAKGSPAFRTIRTTFDAAGVPFEVAVIVSRADYNRMSVSMQGSTSSFHMASF